MCWVKELTSRGCTDKAVLVYNTGGSTASSSTTVFGKPDILNGTAALGVLGPAGWSQVSTTAGTCRKVRMSVVFTGGCERESGMLLGRKTGFLTAPVLAPSPQTC